MSRSVFLAGGYIGLEIYLACLDLILVVVEYYVTLFIGTVDANLKPGLYKPYIESQSHDYGNI